MSNHQIQQRRPLSPVKNAVGGALHVHREPRIAKKIDSSPSFGHNHRHHEAPFAQSTTKPLVRGSRIPRATPSPSPTATHRNQNTTSRIPRPGSSNVSKDNSNSYNSGIAPTPPVRRVEDRNYQFATYSNPSFDDTNVNTALVVHPPPRAHPTGLDTPETIHLLQTVQDTDDNNSHRRADGVGTIMNAMLRTGPQKLSPEPCRDYDIAVPKPAVVVSGGRTREVVVEVGAVATPSPTKNEQEVVPPPSVCSNIPDDVFGDVDERAVDEFEKEFFDSNNNTQHQGDDDDVVVLLDPVDSANHVGIATAAQKYDGVVDQPTHHVMEVQSSPTLAPSPYLACVGSSPSPPAPESAPALPPPPAQNRHVTFVLPDQYRPQAQEQSSGSFSFGMGAAPRPDGGPLPHAPAPPHHSHDNDECRNRSPTPEVFIGPRSAQKKQKNLGDAKKRPGSAESVDQPNPFSSMLHHLQEGGPAACISPGPRMQKNGLMAHAPYILNRQPYGNNKEDEEVVLIASPPPPHSFVQQPQQSSPRSPSNCTPMRLLPEGVPPSVTPELGKGDLGAWIDRRGMRGAMTSPAAADLRRMWNSMREGAGMRAENEYLRHQLAEAQAELARLGDEHHHAVHAAQAGQQWAEAEVNRAREAAQHMMALADQIQATFAACEEEKVALAEELEEAWERVREVEEQAAMAAQQAAAGDEQRQHAVALRKELQRAQAEAEAAAKEASEASAAAQSSAAELAVIKATLERNLMEQQQQAEEEKPATSSDDARGITGTMQAQLMEAHEALVALHASGRNVAGSRSPHLDRMIEASAQNLNKAHSLLMRNVDDDDGGDSDDDFELMARKNEELKALLSGIQSRIMELSPVKNDVGGNATTVKVEVEEVEEPLLHRRRRQGTVTLDYRHLRDVLVRSYVHRVYAIFCRRNNRRLIFFPCLFSFFFFMQAETNGLAVLPTPSARHNHPTHENEVVVDGVLVTNIPADTAPSQVRSMVEYFEELAGVKHLPLSPSPYPSASGGEAQKEEAECSPMMATVDRFRAFLPPSSGENDDDENAMNMVTTPSIEAGEEAKLGGGARPHPTTPAATPADGITPHVQRHHVETLDALAALQEQDYVSASDEDDEEAIVSSSDVELEEEDEEEEDVGRQLIDPFSSTATTTTTTALQPFTPMDFAALSNASGAELRDEVKHRLNRLKEELQAARSKLSRVDQGLAAIASTPSTSASSSSAALLYLPAPPLPPLPGPAVLASTTKPSAKVACTQQSQDQLQPQLSSRPSVRFADSVKFNEVEEEHDGNGAVAAAGAQVPRTPATATTMASHGGTSSVYATIFSQQSSAVPTVMMGQGSTKSQQLQQHQDEEEEGVDPFLGMRRLDLMMGTKRSGDAGDKIEDDSCSDDDDDDLPTAPGSVASRHAVVQRRVYHRSTNANTTPVSRTPMNQYHSYNNTTPTPRMSRFSSLSSYNAAPPPSPQMSSSSTASSTPDPTALLSFRIRPVLRGGGGGHLAPAGAGGGRRVTDSEEREFRRRAAALKIHVSPYFKRKHGRQNTKEDSQVTVL